MRRCSNSARWSSIGDLLTEPFLDLRLTQPERLSKPSRGSGVAGALRRRNRARAGLMVDDLCDDIAAAGLHRRVDQHLAEQVALSVAAAKQPDLFAPRRQQFDDARVI